MFLVVGLPGDVKGSRGGMAGGAMDVSGPKADFFPLGAGPFSLQGMFTCHSAAYGSSSRTWEFSFNGHIILCFDPEKRTWLVVRPEGQQLKEILDQDRDILETFVKISNGECKRWLEAIAESWGQMPETTGNWDKGMKWQFSCEPVCMCVV